MSVEPLVANPSLPSLNLAAAKTELRSIGDRAFAWLLRGAGLLILLLLSWMVVVIVREALPSIQEFGWKFFSLKVWDTGLGCVSGFSANPEELESCGVFGGRAFIQGTLISALIAFALAVPIGVAVALLTSEDFLPRWLQVPLVFILELIAAVPSILIGLWGVTVLVPQTLPLQEWFYYHWGCDIADPSLAGLCQAPLVLPVFSTYPLGDSVMMASLLLALMILPTVTVISRDVFLSLPRSLRSASIALGATPWETILRILLPAAASGIFGAAMLALGRALGESLAVAMVIGNDNSASPSLLSPGASIGSVLVSEMPSATLPLHIGSLMYLALILFVMTLGLNALATLLIQFTTHTAERIDPVAHRTSNPEKPLVAPIQDVAQAHLVLFRHQESPDLKIPLSLGRQWLSGGLLGLTGLGLVMALIPISSLLWTLLSRGMPHLTLESFTQLPAPMGLEEEGPNGFVNAIAGTGAMVGLAGTVSIPLGILVGAYLSEFRRDTLLTTTVRLISRILASVPSVIVGVFVYNLIVVVTQKFSLLAGSVALSLLMLPVIVLATEEALKLVPQDYRVASAALGANRLQTSWTVVLRAALPGIGTGVLLAIAQAAGEAAALLFTAQSSFEMPQGLLEQASSLGVLIYNYALSPFTGQNDLAFTAAVVLLILVAMANLLAKTLTHHSSVGH